MSDIVNAHFRRFYPPDLDRRDTSVWQFRHNGFHTGWAYTGPDCGRRIFPEILCADGYTMSVQAHYGAHCWPRCDFSEEPYSAFEVMAPKPTRPFRQHYYGLRYRGAPPPKYGDRTLFHGVPLVVVLAAIEEHGGMFDWNVADLGVTP